MNEVGREVEPVDNTLEYQRENLRYNKLYKKLMCIYIYSTWTDKNGNRKSAREVGDQINRWRTSRPPHARLQLARVPVTFLLLCGLFTILLFLSLSL